MDLVVPLKVPLVCMRRDAPVLPKTGHDEAQTADVCTSGEFKTRVLLLKDAKQRPNNIISQNAKYKIIVRPVPSSRTAPPFNVFLEAAAGYLRGTTVL